MKRLVKPVAAAVLASAFTVGMAAPALAASDRVVLISWDGVRRDVLNELIQYQPIGETPVPCPHGGALDGPMPTPCGDYLTCLPNICQFQIIESNAVEGKTLTRPQHAQMLTGYGPPETGEITNNGSAQLPKGVTIYEHLAIARPEIRTVHLAGLKFIGRGVVRWALEDGSLDLMLRRGSRDRFTGVNTTEQVGVGFEFIGNWPTYFYFMHYKSADVVAHRAGDGSDAYREGIMANDTELGQVMAMLAERGELDSTKLYVTTDHGFNGIFHLGLDNPNVTQTWIASKDFDLDGGPATILDVTPTILDAFGIDPSIFTPPYRGSSRLLP